MIINDKYHWFVIIVIPTILLQFIYCGVLFKNIMILYLALNPRIYGVLITIQPKKYCDIILFFMAVS